MAEETAARRRVFGVRAADAYGVDDSPATDHIELSRATRKRLVDGLGVSVRVADALIAARRRRPIRGPSDLEAIKELSAEQVRAIRSRALFAGEEAFHITDVRPVGRAVFSDRPFALRIGFQNPDGGAMAVAAVTVLWAGRPFVVERRLPRTAKTHGTVEVRFDAKRALPVGPAEFQVALYRSDGAQASFRKTFYVLPSNPLALTLSPAGATVTGTWSARGDYHPENDTFLTECTVTIANGDGGAVSMNRRVDWSFWDGPVGSGTRVESGSFNWGGPITVPAHGTWQGGVWFSSPNGSGIYDRYHRKEDMAISIEMTASDGRRISGEITCRVTLAYGVNIIKVGDFGAQEHSDLYAAVDQTRQIYEARDIAFRGIDRRIINNSLAGSFTMLNDDPEFRNLLRSWSVPNDWVDVYVVQKFQWSSYNGMAGDIPGPASKGGDKDGVAVDKSGYADSSGTARLDITTLGKLIGHEVGHYLGLSHTTDSGRLMLANTGVRGTTLTYDEYRLMFPHGFMVFL